MSDSIHKDEKEEIYKISSIREKFKIAGFVAIFITAPVITLLVQLNSQYKFFNIFG